MNYTKGATVKFALKQSLPVLFGYLFLGSAFGIMLYKAGYNWLWAIFISLIVYAGSGQFLLVSLISAKADIATTALMTLFINTRHMFYGLSYIEKFKAGKWRYPFMIFTLTDETYSVNSSILSVPENVDEPKARFLIGEFNHFYWIAGSALGSLLSGAVGVFCAVICLIIFGADKFLLPSLLITVVILSSFKKFFETEEVAK